MLSSTTVRRVKERGGAGGKIMASKTQKTLTPFPDKENAGSCKKIVGKEKPRSVSATRVPPASQKPLIRSIPMSQIDKTAGPAKDGEGRVRCSTTSLARGKNSKPNPSDFVRILSDIRKDRLSTGSSSSTRSVNTVESSSVGGTNLVSNGGKGLNGFKVTERHQQNRPSSNPNSKDNELKVVGGCRKVDSGKDNRKMDSLSASEAKSSYSYSSGVGALDDCKEKINLSSHLMASDEKVMNSSSESSKDKFYLDSRSQVSSEVIPNRKSSLDNYSKGAVGVAAERFVNVGKSRDMACLDSKPKQICENTLAVSEVSEISKEKIAVEGKGVRAVNKYPSKLHEKLAFLEGKVKRIASDIKRTKEMLDMNNTDASKMILSDIQDKISGIEKAIVHVVKDDGSNLDSSKTVESSIPHCKSLDKAETKQLEQPKSLAKDLNHEELEARLFPHRKLLRSRTSVSTTGSSLNHLQSSRDQASESKPENGSLSPIDENPIALEFLASLNINQSKVSTREEHADLEFSEIQEMDGSATPEAQDNIKIVDGKRDLEIEPTSSESLEDSDDEENRPVAVEEEETDDSYFTRIRKIGRKTATGGWFVMEGEAVLLAHDDGSCSYYDITHVEEKALFMPPVGLSPNMWGDCWMVRAPDGDGHSKKYVVAASAGNIFESGFCSWDYYTRDVQAFHTEEGKTISSSRTVLGQLPNCAHRRGALSTVSDTEDQQWWYKPCGPLIVSTASGRKAVKVYDIRDGELMMKWDVQRPVLEMDYSSPLHWRSRGRVVLTDTENISLWDVNSLNPNALVSVSSAGRKVSALHVNNTDAELGGGVRQRVSPSEAVGNDGVFCTGEGINILDFRLPSGVGLKLSKLGVTVQSVFSRGDSIFLGCTNTKPALKESSRSQIQQFSLRNGRLLNTYAPPYRPAYFHSTAITQVWGNSKFVMGVCSLGMFVFDTLKDYGKQTIPSENIHEARHTIGPDNMCSPSFDYSSSRVLLISKDRPARWRHLMYP